MSRKGGNEVCEGVVELILVGVDVVVGGGGVTGNNVQTVVAVIGGVVSRRSDMGRRLIRALETYGSPPLIRPPSPTPPAYTAAFAVH